MEISKPSEAGASRVPAVNKSPLFDSPDGWSSGYALASGHGPGVVVGPGTNNPNAFAQQFTTSSRVQYKVAAQAQAVDTADAKGAIQINWFDGYGNFISTFKVVLDASPQLMRFEHIVTAPTNAASGLLYVIPGRERDVVRYTEMAVTRLDPFYDFASYRFLGMRGIDIAAGVAIILVFGLLYVAYRNRVFHVGKLIAARIPAVLERMFPIIAAGLCAVLFVYLEGAYEQHYDSHWHQSAIESVMRWKHASIDLGGDILHNFGIQHVINPHLSPTMWIGSLAPQDHRIQVEAAFQALLMFAILVQICRIGGARTSDAAAVSLVAVFYLWVPLLSDEAISLSATLGLLWQEGVLATLMAVACFCLIGRDNGAIRPLPIVGLTLSVFWVYLAYPEIAPFFTLATGLACLGALFGIRSRREFLTKAAVSVCIVALMAGLGLHSFMLNLFNYTPQLFYEVVRETARGAYGVNSLLNNWSAVGGVKLIVFFLLAAFGAITAWIRSNSFGRQVVLAAVALELGIHALGVINGFVRVAPLAFTYVELTGFAIVALLAGVGVWTTVLSLATALVAVGNMIAHRNLIDVAWIRGAPARQSIRSLACVLIIGAAAWVVYQMSLRTIYFSGWPPDADSRPVQIQRQALAAKPGEGFRGKGIVLVGTQKRRRIEWFSDAFQVMYYKHRVAFGNDLMNDAEAFDVPMSYNYGHWISPPMLALMAAAFYNPEDHIGRAAQVFREFRPNLARLLGVSLVVSDGPLPGQVELYRGVAVDHPVYIHRVTDANLGQYSPTTTVVANSAKEILDRLLGPDFDGRRLAILERPVDKELVPAERVSVTLTTGPRIHVEAYAPGTSLLVLPFEYSHCLQVEGNGLEQLIPVNLAQIGLVVHGEVSLKIEYRYGVIKGTECRKQDLQRANALHLAEAAQGRLFNAAASGKRTPDAEQSGPPS